MRRAPGFVHIMPPRCSALYAQSPVAWVNLGWLHLQRLLQPELARGANSPPEHLAAARSPEPLPAAVGQNSLRRRKFLKSGGNPVSRLVPDMFSLPRCGSGSRDDQDPTAKFSGKVTPLPLFGSRGPRRPLLAEEVAGDDDAHDLVGAFEDLMHAQVAQIALDRKVLEVAVAAMQLQRLVGDMKTGIGREALGHRAFLCRFR